MLGSITVYVSFPEYSEEERGRFSKGMKEAGLLLPFFFSLSFSLSLSLLPLGGMGGNVRRMEKKRKLFLKFHDPYS